MGIDYYVCSVCGDTFPDCGEYYTCSCGRHYCCQSCADEDGAINPCDNCEFEKYSDVCKKNGDCDGELDYDFASCKICRHEEYEDDSILKYLLEKLKLTKEIVINEMKSKKYKK